MHGMPALVLAAALLLPSALTPLPLEAQAASEGAYDVVIRNGRVLDGAGRCALHAARHDPR